MAKKPARDGTYLVNGVAFRGGNRVWTAADDKQLRQLYPDMPTAQLAKQIRRTLTAIYARARKLGIEKSAAYLSSPHACRLRRGDNVGARFRFPKGHVPANKGLRRPGWHRGRMKETQFKKGESRNRMALGSTRLVDGYVYVKLAEVPHVPYYVNWFPVHVIEWERVHGPMPPGHALAFRNGDRLDTRLENLELITRRALMARNTVHNLPKPLASAIQLLGQLKRKIREKGEREEQNRRSA